MVFSCSEVSGDREVQRTMLELLNQLDGFSSDDRIKVLFYLKLFIYFFPYFVVRILITIILPKKYAFLVLDFSYT